MAWNVVLDDAFAACYKARRELIYGACNSVECAVLEGAEMTDDKIKKCIEDCIGYIITPRHASKEVTELEKSEMFKAAKKYLTANADCIAKAIFVANLEAELNENLPLPVAERIEGDVLEFEIAKEWELLMDNRAIVKEYLLKHYPDYTITFGIYPKDAYISVISVTKKKEVA